MIKYTEGQGYHRHASVVMNLGGTGGLEVWQYLSRIPKFLEAPISIRDFGVFASIIGSATPEALYKRLKDIHLK